MDEPGIRKFYNPPEKIKLDLRYVYDRFQTMRESRSADERAWDKWDKMYEMYREDRTDWQSNFVVPTTTSIIESQLSEIIDLNYRPYYLPRGVEDKPRAVVMNQASDFAWEVGRGDVEVYKMCKSALVRGTGVGQEYFRQEKRMVQWLVNVDKKKGEQYEKREILDYDDCFTEALPLEDLYVDENGRGFSGPFRCKDAIRRYIMHIDDFKAFFQGDTWNPLGAAKFVKAGGDTNYYQFYKPQEGIDKSKMVEVLWYWSERPTPGRPLYSDHLMIVANDVMVVWGPNPYWHKRLPFVRSVDILRPHNFYGTGEPKLLESIQEEQQTFRRMIIDRNHLDIDKGFLVSNRESELDEEDVITRPHMIIEVDDVNNVKPLEYGDIPRSVLLSADKLQEDAVRVTGYDDRMQSVRTPGTATEAAILKEATLKRLRSKIWLLRNLSVYEIGQLRESNIRQFYTRPKMDRILGEGSSEYHTKVRSAYQSGRLRMVEGEPYELKYRTIRLEDKELIPTEKGIAIKKSKEPTFFEVVPDLITPVYGSFDVRIEPTPVMPVTKPLQQEQADMLFDRLIQLSLQGIGYDPVKLADNLIEGHDMNPDELKPDEALEDKMQGQLMEKMVELATVENKELMKGQALPPTPFAAEPHTEVHIAFINSPEMMDIPPDSPVLANLTQHIVGELQAQQQRGAAQPAQPQQPNYKPPSGPSAVRQENVIPQQAEAAMAGQQQAQQMAQAF